MLGRLIIFLFCFMGVLSLVMANVPAGFYVNQTSSWNPSYSHQDEAVVDYFTAHNLTVYDNQINDTIAYDSMNEYEFGLPGDEMLQVVWEEDPLIGVTTHEFTLRHKTGEFLWTWDIIHSLEFKKEGFPFMIGLSVLTKEEVVDGFQASLNGSYWVAQCDHIITNVLIKTNSSAWTLAESWDNNQLQYLMSYEINMTKMGFNVWSLIGQLLTFQSPDFGVPGVFGTLLNGVIALPLWGGILYALYKLVSGLIPFVSGGGGD